ncbi:MULTISPECIES: GGDEF domain-containing protein [unclassified Janthinobacterium]|uniref:GGDEF domain-containing protein n=1 Tax=unclassified Janthinobacterium TaxID=2610881 RepID=UPI0004766F8C|nr:MULTISPECIES: GGDEF domain-containing protein [unclassified Janthinobacterium]MEC5158911.1 diguanylate cyclase (GGDEF)-like protein [Janthinobacterium sp. CG_S6]
MDSLLKHMVDMTGHRDHTMLDISVISAVQELAGAAQTRVLALTRLRGQVFVRARAVISAGSAARMEEHSDSAAPGEPLECYPALAACIAGHQASADTVCDDGRHMLWLPIWIGDKADTCLEITNPTPYSGATIQVVGGIVSVYRNFQNLLDYSERDSLTGLLNRKTFDDQLAKVLQSGGDYEAATPPGERERRQPPQTEKQWLAVVDVDHFKLVNDKFGHLYGDEVLILIANLMQSSFRAQDRIFRFGGEEFVVLLRSSTLADAHKIIDRFRINVETHDFPQVGRITVSVGFVSLNAAEAPVIILGRADQALYYAKSHGRNLACHYDELVETGQLHAVASNDTAEFF